MTVCRVDKNTTTYDVVWLMLKRSCREGWKASVKASVSGVPFPPLGQITNYSPDISKLNDVTSTTIICRNDVTSLGAFNLSEMASRTSQLANESAFSKGFLQKNHLHLGFDWSRWIVLIKSKILITPGMVWLVSSDKWNATFSCEQAFQGALVVGQKERRAYSHISGIWISKLEKSMQNADWHRWIW